MRLMTKADSNIVRNIIIFNMIYIKICQYQVWVQVSGVTNISCFE